MYQQYSRKVFWLIIISAIIKLLVAGLLELGNDEVYYWTYAIQPDWNHFDHPPMVGWLIRLTTLNLWWSNEVTVRAGAIICSGLSTWIIFKLGKLLDSERVGWLAALMYTLSVYTGFIAGLFILPDSPQMLFWVASLYLMAYLLLKREEENLSIWLLLGLTIGLAALSKVHGLYLWAGFGAFLLFTRIQWLTNWRLYMAVLVTLICISPIIYWNIANDFITYKFHSARVTHTNLQWDMLGREIAGEALYQHPFLFVLTLLALFSITTNRIRFGRKRIRTWLLWMSLPMILLFWGIALFNPTLPHWAGPAYIPLYFIAALYLQKQTNRNYPVWMQASFVLIVVVLTAGIILVRYSPVNFGSQQKENYGEYCPTLDLSGWRNMSTQFDELYKADIASGRMNKNTVLLTHKWFPGGHLEFYTARKSGIALIGVGELQDLHKFAWLNKERGSLQMGMDAYYILPSNLPYDVKANLGKYFTQMEEPVIIHQMRSGKEVRYFYVYRLKNAKQSLPQILP
ncbi:ArnT family glycosyltransferase [Sediminibacterium goheungense]|uniref:Dolichyl-phosphate-mannose-protein mannosyltransferase n=1 Tax=Sediminibacterium goheungense TaxID=1086393 RepID=A0A4R6IZN1_9BACT|nr:glycosyltransferase family 39 protein [Sediminibacterium goheungense]TDO28369.1 dolichyl-phosphate-mannose-protein mannosyltransferase [Sediminibacterium goheungense]